MSDAFIYDGRRIAVFKQMPWGKYLDVNIGLIDDSIAISLAKWILEKCEPKETPQGYGFTPKSEYLSEDK